MMDVRIVAVINEKKQLQYKMYDGDRFIRYVPNRQCMHLWPFRPSLLTWCQTRHKGAGGMIINYSGGTHEARRDS